jgi:hypothetical protein
MRGGQGMKRAVLLVLAAAGVLSGLLSACGGGDSSSAAVTSPAKLAKLSAHRPHKGAGDTAPSCRSASVTLGEAAGEIDFRVDCVARGQRETVGVSIGRVPIGSGVHSTQDLLSGIRSFSRSPAVSGPGRLKGTGVCRRVASGNRVDRSGLSCEALSRGRVRIQGRIFVSPTSRCKKKVEIQATGGSGCRQPCAPSLPIALLADEVPRGC